MTTPTGPTDHLEPRLRRLLAERAELVDPRPPGLPTGEPRQHSLVPSAPGRGRRRALVAAGLVAAGLIVVGALAAGGSGGSGGDERTQVVATTPTTTAAVDLAEATPLFRAEGETDPVAAARRYLLARLGDGTEARRRELLEELELQAGAATGHRGASGAVPVTWRLDRTPDDVPAMAVWVEPGTRGSNVLEATVDGVDLQAATYDLGRLHGELDLAAIERPGRTIATLTRAGGMPLLEEDRSTSAAGDEPISDRLPTTRPFDLPIKASGNLVVQVRVDDDWSRPVVLAEAPLTAPVDPEDERLATMTSEERSEYLRTHVQRASDSPACKEAGAWRMPDPVPFPQDVVPNASTPTDDVIAAGVDDRPGAALARLAEALGVSFEAGDVSFATEDSAYLTVRLPATPRLVDVEVWRRPGTATWQVTSVRTRGACRDFGGSNLTPLGDPDPRTRLGLPVVAGAASGEHWFRDPQGTWRAEVTSDDLAAHAIAVRVDQAELTGRAVVLRDAAGIPVLWDLSRD